IEAERINKGDLELTLVDTFGGELPAFRVGHLLEEGNTLEFGDLSLRVLHTPGHSAGSICLHEERLGIIITGDTLFPGGSFGRVDLPTGNYQDLLASLKRLSEIDFEIALPGHMNPIRRDAKRAAYLSYEVARGMFSSW
ncbi:MAG: MBL fold metallo-hydrolase, partial [Candidatus Thorarchaeota archaeon]